MTLNNALSKELKARLEEIPFFNDWQRISPREYRKQDGTIHMGIDLQLDKWWLKTGGKIAMNLSCGHQWKTPTFGWMVNGVDFSSARLSPRDNHDHWWQVGSVEQVTEFGNDLQRLLVERGVPWFDLVSTKEGFLGWYSSVFPESSAFPYILEVKGRAVAVARVCRWLEKLPRGIERQLTWFVNVEIMSEDISNRIRLASLQAVETYQKQVTPLISEIQQYHSASESR